MEKTTTADTKLLKMLSEAAICYVPGSPACINITLTMEEQDTLIEALKGRGRYVQGEPSDKDLYRLWAEFADSTEGGHAHMDYVNFCEAVRKALRDPRALISNGE